MVLMGGHIMDGLFFYWVMWMAWVFVMFFIPGKAAFRYALLFHILATIYLSFYELHIKDYSFNGASIYVLANVLFYHRHLPFLKVLYFILGSIILSLGYTSFQMFAMLDPVWVVVD